MRNRTSMTKARRRQGGYALLLVVFLTALLVVSTMSIGLRILTEGKREKEQEMIWRGQQYTRGIKLYYRKLGRFPTSLEDLTKPKVGTLRFMRQAYKDPMNKDDGSWRLIYVGPSGQLIGSLKPPESLQLAAGGGLGTSAAAVAGASGGQSPSLPGASGFGSSSGSGFGSSNSSGFGSSSSSGGFG